ncbi:helix-turn-helix transcriptional regulator [Pseudomonas sp. A2]|uniref:helix-turn-helix domain-containing protein n=1 Tax=Pseudomonas sp. A2 TaxID=107445 RepID=UPI002C068021|nr:helix-turn-helix transcriptional regulator [Pseudomonas sp. A2]MEB3438065.1 helix-turn-helix transcriptional regulator [Pseudomonas sp. A2]
MDSFIHHMTCNCTTHRGYILAFEDIVLLKPALAAVVRTIREKLGFTQENLANAASRTYLSKIENAASSPTVEKFAELAEVLGLSPTALMALVVSTRDNLSTAAVLTKAHAELENLGAKVSAEDIRLHLTGVEVAKRPASRPADIAKLQKVLACKDAGLTRAETARRLGLTRSTVGFLWTRSLPAED